MLFCIVPAFRAAATIYDVVADVLPYVDAVVVVDDHCPDASGDIVRRAFDGVPNVHVVFRERNGGVGAAFKTGLEFALAHGARFVVKIDADGQMDPEYIASIAQTFEQDPTVVFVKGNRFADVSVLKTMPRLRFFGNAVLSLLVKFSSGYWNILDPTNGYIAFNCAFLDEVGWRSFADSY